MAIPASSGQVARTPVFAKEHLGSGKVQEFFRYRAPKRWKDAPFFIYSLPVGTSFAFWWFWGDSICASWTQNLGEALCFSVGSAPFPDSPGFFLDCHSQFWVSRLCPFPLG